MWLGALGVCSTDSGVSRCCVGDHKGLSEPICSMAHTIVTVLKWVLQHNCSTTAFTDSGMKFQPDVFLSFSIHQETEFASSFF